MAERQDYHGSLVAFEGSTDKISTQLRLLPTSPQILILPSVQNFLPEDAYEEPFQAASYVRKVHDAAAARTEIAMAFLREATASSKRLVFTNGGMPSCLSLCIRAIAQHETDDDLTRAEHVFHDMILDGISGLSNYQRERNAAERVERVEREEDDGQDPITRAMRAADALDERTSDLQPDTDIDLTIKPRPRSISLPIYGYADYFGDSAPFYVFGASQTDHHDGEHRLQHLLSPTTPRFAVSHFDRLDRETEESGCEGGLRSPSCIGEVYMAGSPSLPLDCRTPVSDVFGLDDDGIEYGEASVVTMLMTAQRRIVKRVTSLDRIYFGATRSRDLCLHSSSSRDPAIGDLPRPFSCVHVKRTTDQISNRLSYLALPKTIFVKPSRSSIASSCQKRKEPRASYVDRGTDAEEIQVRESSFQGVLPLTEDLTIYFKDDNPDPLLGAMIQSCRDGAYPVASPSAADLAANEHPDEPGTPRSEKYDCMDHSVRDVEASISERMPDDYDPFAYNQRVWPPEKILTVPHVPSAPPTPAQTPTKTQEWATTRTSTPTLRSESLGERFHDFDTMHCHTAVCLQNALRSTLGIYFPPEDTGYRQFHFPLLPELDGLWKPIFREADPGNSREHDSKIDMILAIGSQRGVKREFLTGIKGRLEKMGTKQTGISRSGRLDFRYLIANAMQAFTAQPLTNQTQENPFTNSYLLATLIVPHLETYLATHSEVRFLLLEYPADHLATVLAVQKLVGVDLMKVVQIVDADANEPHPFNHIRGASINTRATDPELLSPGPRPSIASSTRSLPSVSALMPAAENRVITKANFLLTSTASDSEITQFTSTIWKLLMDISSFYIPEEQPPAKKSPSSSASPRKRPPPITGPFSPFPKSPGISPPLSPPPRCAPPRPGSPASTKAPSVAETVKTSRSGKRHRRGQSRGRTMDGESVLDLEDDSDVDAEERRLMPMFLKKPPVRKGNSRKALKFLGLA